MISVAILGPVEVRRDGAPVGLPAGKTTEVLMRLAIAAGTMVRTELLFEEIWGADAATVGRNALQSKISQLRRALGDPTLVVGTAIGYTLALDADAVDALAVVRLAAEAAALREAGDSAGCVRVCSKALDLYRGESLFGANDAEWLIPHRARLDEVRIQLAEKQLSARLDMGAAGEIVSDLEMLTATYPLREGLSALLITALYRDGRQAEALATYRSVRERLAEELGLDPGPELQKLEQQILDQDPGLDVPTSERQPVRGSTGGGLPPISSAMVGRDRDLAELRDRIGDHRLVTVVGPAGVGKTRLAIEVARHTDPADGSWLVRLDHAPTPDKVLETVADVLHAAGPSDEALTDRLRGAEVLVVVDNCEHVLDAAADVIDTLLSAAPGVRVLATSQVPLGLDGESVYLLAPLSMEDSQALFAARAAAHSQKRPSGTDADSTLAAVCRSLDGLPLAIELAAARTKSLTLDEIAHRLEDRFQLLADPTGRRPERQRRLSTAIAWSYDLLFPDDQRGLMALACFVGGAPLDAAEAVLRALGVPSEAAVDVVSRLVDRSLVVFDAPAEDGVRYRLLDSVRSFAAERLEEAGEASAALRAHCEWVAAAAATAAAGTKGPEQVDHVSFVRRERANIDAALAWAAEHDPALGVQIASDLGWTWVVLGDAVGAQRLATALDAADGATDAATREPALLAVGWLEASAGDVVRAVAAVDEAFELIDRADPDRQARAEWYRAYVLSQQGAFDESLTLLDAARAVFHDHGDAWNEAATWVLAGHCHLGLGDPLAATVACTEAFRQLALVADPWLLIHTEAILGGIAQGEQRFADACEHLARASAEAGRLGFAATEAYHLANLGRAQHQAGDLSAATDTLRRSIETARATGDLRVAALARVRLGRVIHAQGDLEGALTEVATALNWYRAAGGGDGARLAECLYAAMGGYAEPEQAIAHLESLLTDAHTAGDHEVEVLTLDALARIRADQGDLAAATVLLASADDVMPLARHHVTDADRLDADAARQLTT